MERQDIQKQYTEFCQACGRTQFAVEREKKKLLSRRRQLRESAAQALDSRIAAVQQQARQRCSALVQQLQGQLAGSGGTEQPILQAAEYLRVGTLHFRQLSQDAAAPFLLPFLGHGNLLLAAPEEDLFPALRSLIFSVLDQTAPGQIRVCVYNPELKNTFSCFSELEQYTMLATPEHFSGELETLSREIVATDGLLKGRYASLLELRTKAQQAVGQLRLYVVAGRDWLKNESLRKQLLRAAENGVRAGCAFLFAVDPGHLRDAAALLPKAQVISRQSGGSWIPGSYPTLEMTFTPWEAREADAFLADYTARSEKTSVVTIPFDSIEDTRNCWTGSTAEGIDCSLGKVGLETVTLRLGDKNTQLHNVLITGAPGKGKSNLLEVMIHSMCCRYSPRELELYLLDFKDGLTFKPYSYSPQRSWLPHARVLGLESARDFGVAALAHIEAERQNRALRMNSVEASSLVAYRAKRPEDPMPRIVILIDEYQKLVEVADDLGRRAAELIENIVRQGRACGIHMVLASQTVAHGAALMGREDQIYPAFPVRIALQNTLQESYATFVQGNDAAARLRVRGEAVINVNYGALDSNRKFSVAYADPDAMLALRKSWCSRPDAENHIPMVFSKNDEFHLSDAVRDIRSWRSNVLQGGAPPMLVCGQIISVSRKVAAVRMSSDAGRNVAILGSGDGEKKAADALPPNYAVGLIENMAISLALQHPQGDARFVLINGLEPGVARHNGLEQWLHTMERFGLPVEEVEPRQAPAFFVQMAAELKQPPTGEACYILALGMDRCPGMADAVGDDPFNVVTGASALQDLLKNGPPRGVHLIAWWSNVAMYREHIGFNGDGYIDTKILLRLDDATSKDVLGPFVSWNGAAHRALLHDATDLQADLTLIPMSPCTMRDTGKLEAVVWE
ncbi:FtsK/SpoIIIE family protein [Subdoligranulum variabile DSM 15176]|uniref:FtsK/SpoIIIE family protein n=1 Tax=Subdoligranulum variabile DSM 15176 TaxID=411471 RepID=D1PS36_9FIRM|nr:FtsK/SpoIIIE domain-containing protein [Subdoligranulum variabile]EFB74564.1 FtsK/SpoIIIE family protein [Subdoligranulum variabile DSM 15176]UWP69531.1 FtsK/SpoIIIE domain-containing protein [Subdoligranulum variabile]